MRIPNYTQGLAIKRDTPNTVDLSQISRAGDVASGVGDIAGVGFELAARQKNASDMSAQNEAVITSKSEAIDYSESFKAQNRESPIGASERFKSEFKKLHEEKAKGLPNDIVKQSYLREMDNLSLSYQREIKSWETETVVAQSVDRASNSIETLKKMALGGASPEALRNDIDSTMFTLSDSLSESERVKFKNAATQDIAKMFYVGLIQKNVGAAEQLMKKNAYADDLSAEDIVKISGAIEEQKKSNVALAKKALLEQQEAGLIQQLENKQKYMNIIQSDDISTDQKIVEIRKADMLGQLRREDAREMLGYIQSTKAIDAITNAEYMGEILTHMHDLNTIAGQNQKDYLIGVENVRRNILEARANGKLSADDEMKLTNQMKTLMSAKTADATNAISYSFGQANKTIKEQLPPEKRGEATRRLFYEVEGELVNDEAKKTGKDVKKIYAQRVHKIIDEMNQESRKKAINLVTDLQSKKPAAKAEEEEFLKSINATEQDVIETMHKYNITREEVLQQLRGK